MFRCPDCRKRQSVRSGSWFEQRGHTSLAEQLHLIIGFINHNTATSYARQWDLNRNTVHHYFHKFLNMIDSHIDLLMDVGDLNFIGGTIECDVLNVRHVYDDANNVMIDPLVIFGMLERETGYLHLEIIAQESQAVVQPVVAHHIPAGSTIITDSHGAYLRLGDDDYYHYSVNHEQGDYSHDDVDPLGFQFTVTANHIEQIWSILRPRLHNRQDRNLTKLRKLLKHLMFESCELDIFDLFRV